MNESQESAKLLIVDDDSTILKLLKKITEDNGWQCVTAPDAATAHEILAGQFFDLLVTDIQMPGESGVDLIRFAKKKYPHMAIVIESVISDPQEAKSILELGIYGYITKPFERHQALITINNALIRRNLETQLKNRNRKLERAVRQRMSEYDALLVDLVKAKSKITATAKYHKDQLLFMQTLLNAIPNPIYYKDVYGVYQGCNHAFETHMGHNRNEIVGRTVHDIAPKAIADRYQLEDEKLIKQSGRQTYEGKVKYADGSMRDVLFNKATFQNSSGTVDGLVGVMVDITNRKQKERALRISEEKNRTILENIGMGLALLTPQMEILEMNNKMQQWFPEAKANSASVCYESFIDRPRNSPCGPCPTRKTLEDGQVHEAVIQCQLEDGKRDFKIISSAIFDDDGKVVAAIVLLNDITEELAMEREFRQTQKLASIGQLAAGVAHEINNPTGFVSSNLRTLKDYQNDLNQLLEQYRSLKEGIRNKDQIAMDSFFGDTISKIESTEQDIDIEYIIQDIGELIEESQEGTERIKKIVDDLKHFAHPGQDKVQDTDINRELASTLNVVHNELKYKAKVVTQFNDLPIIMANPQQLNQVFINILVNAAQAIENMGEIRIETQHVDGHVQIRISDTGCGIPEKNLAKIFDPFFTTKEVGKGTGLGMNIAYNIIQKHSGDIQIKSRVGEGTTFVISLPVELHEEQDQGSETGACIPEDPSCSLQTALQV